MTYDNDKLGLSRRKVLGGLGMIGLASAGAGLGTTAYFSDEETFTGNQMTAGSLDLKVGWEEHYSDWSDDENDGLSGSVQMTDPPGGPVPAGRVGLPSNDHSLISVQDSIDAKQFLDNTQEDVYPNGYDSDDFPTGTPIDCDSTILTDDPDVETGTPVIDLDDVKPGDFGEVTFSFAICDNPGYVWAQAFLEDASENGITEPEAADDDEEESVPRSERGDSDDDEVELLDVIQVAVWLDDGNNFQNCGEKPLVVDSLRNVINNIPNPGLRLDGRNIDHTSPNASDPTNLTAYGVNRFDIDGGGTFGGDVELADDPVDAGKVAHATSGGVSTPDYVTSSVCLPSGTTIGDVDTVGGLTYEYYQGVLNENAAPDEAILLIQDDNDAHRVVSRTWNDGESGPSNNWITREVGQETRDNFGSNSGRNWVEATATGGQIIGSDLTTDSAISGSSQILAMAVGRGNVDPGDSRILDVYYRNPSVDESSIGPFPTSCFRGDGTVYNGVFAWWIPVDHGNEIQTDSAMFSLGLYTEQCRHNDGSGMPINDTSGNITGT